IFLYSLIHIYLHWLVNLHTLPSFPTRRSSDLLGNRFLSDSLRLSSDDLSAIYTGLGIAGLIATFWHEREQSAGAASDHAELIKRSEEHTSELQSRENLVCRLLLEKKKKKITN